MIPVVSRPAPPVPRITDDQLAVVVVPHRGDINPIDGWPENTLPAVEQAMERVGRFEVDLLRSADGTFWCIHDSTVNRTTTSTGNVADKTDAQMAALVIDGGFGYRGQTGLGVPSLDALLSAVGTPTFAIFDLKEISDAAHTALAEYVVAANLEGNVRIGCVTLSGAAAVKTVSSSIETSVQTGVSLDISDEPDVDVLGAPHTLVTEQLVANNAPKGVSAWHDASASTWMNDEKSIVATVVGAGCFEFVTNDLIDALLYTNPTYIYAP